MTTTASHASPSEGSPLTPSAEQDAAHPAPTIVYLGSLAEITQGAFPGTADAFGGADFSIEG